MTSLLKKITYKVLSHFLWIKPYNLHKRLDEIGAAAAIGQLQLAQTYRNMVQQGLKLPAFGDTEFRVFSENGEDGLLVFLFAVIGTTNKISVEICGGDGITNCTANLIVYHGWQGYLFEGNPARVAIARDFYRQHQLTRQSMVTIAQEWISPSTINDTLTKHGLSGEVDLLSLDMDSLDYWVWEQIDVISPRAMICEFNNLWPADKALTVPNDPQFKPEYNSSFGADFSGATLAAFVKLGKRKGYRLVGGQRLGYNALFLRNDVGAEHFPEVDPASLLQHPFAVYARTERNKVIRDKPWVEV